MKFRNAHACAKHHKSFRDYELLCRLDKVKRGLTPVQDMADSIINVIDYYQRIKKI
jgi:hypothetical protein